MIIRDLKLGDKVFHEPVIISLSGKIGMILAHNIDYRGLWLDERDVG